MTKEPSLEALEHAERLLKYFQRVSQENVAEVWRKGLVTAQEWLRLIKAENSSNEEISKFMGIVHANRYRTSGWLDLALGAYHWANTKEVGLLASRDFFASDSLPSFHFDSFTLLEYADILIQHFQLNTQEDPNYDPWMLGLNIARDWRNLLIAPQVTTDEASEITQRVYKNNRKYLSSLWFDMAIGIYNWCHRIGYWEILPEDCRKYVVPEHSQ
jgi:hypothetical protein